MGNKLFNKYIEETIPKPEDRELLQIFAGSCLSADKKFGKALVLSGFGKTTLLHILRDLVGRDNCSYVSLIDFQSLYHRILMFNKILNMSTLNSIEQLESKSLKELLSSDSVTAAFKYHKTIEFKPFCNFIFTVNSSEEEVTEYLSSFESGGRIAHINLEKPKSPDPHILEKLLVSRASIFMWALEGAEDHFCKRRSTGMKKTLTALKLSERLDTVNNVVALLLKLLKA